MRDIHENYSTYIVYRTIEKERTIKGSDDQREQREMVNNRDREQKNI
jgi:hypothetical protein